MLDTLWPAAIAAGAMGVGSDSGIDSNSVEQVLRKQAHAVRRRDQVRQAASLAVWPSALAGAVLISRFGASGGPDAFVSWMLLTLAVVLLFATFGWWAVRQLTPRMPPWPHSRRAARIGAWVGVVVASVVAGLLARTVLFAALVFWSVEVWALVMLWRREREFDQRVSQLGHDAAVLVGYR